MVRRGAPLVPARFVSACALCGDALDIRANGNYQKAHGWVKIRAQGGANAIALPEREAVYACPLCIEGRPRLREWQQLPLDLDDA